MIKQSPGKINQRPSAHAEAMTLQHSAEIQRVLDTLEREQTEVEFGKWVVLGIMLLLLMLPAVYLFVAGFLSQPTELSEVSTESVSTVPSAAGTPPATASEIVPAPPQEEPDAATVIKELELATTMTNAEAAPTPPPLKPDSAPAINQIGDPPMMTPKHASRPYRKTDRRKDVDDATLKVRTADGQAARTPVEIQPESLNVTESSAIQPEKRAEFNREIVVRAPGESTQSLVNRCRALGLIEGELCRVRICTGIWGIDPACPATGHASGN
jgi:hypothetical protein